jgi:hypothetical protein
MMVSRPVTLAITLAISLAIKEVQEARNSPPIGC